eukprot:scaffold247020_cov21-Tisochrysis_lutea.AAC.2
MDQGRWMFLAGGSHASAAQAAAAAQASHNCSNNRRYRCLVKASEQVCRGNYKPMLLPSDCHHIKKEQARDAHRAPSQP